MRPSNRSKARLGFLLGGLAAVFSLFLFQLFRHPETAAMLVALPGPAALGCTIRCVGVGPLLQVLGEGLKALLLIAISASFVYALVRTAARMFRTWTFVDGARKRAVPGAGVPGMAADGRVTVFDDPFPTAFTAGFLAPEVFVSTGLLAALDENEVRAVLLHELHHRECRDPLKGLAVSFVSDFLFFLPASRSLKTSYQLAAEMTADARSVARQADPLDLASSLLKVRNFSAPAASWFSDPAAERARHLLGEPVKLSLPLKTVFLTVIVLAIVAAIAAFPVRRSVTAMFIDHDKTCVLNSGRG